MIKHDVEVVNTGILVFKNEPPTPPSYAQAQPNKDEESGNFFESIKRLVSNRSYMLLLISYGINTGIFYAISTLLNQIILLYYPVGLRCFYNG